MSAPRERRRHMLSVVLCTVLGALLALGGISTLRTSIVLGFVFIAIGALSVLGGLVLVQRDRRRGDRD